MYIGNLKNHDLHKNMFTIKIRLNMLKFFLTSAVVWCLLDVSALNVLFYNGFHKPYNKFSMHRRFSIKNPIQISI